MWMIVVRLDGSDATNRWRLRLLTYLFLNFFFLMIVVCDGSSATPTTCRERLWTTTSLPPLRTPILAPLRSLLNEVLDPWPLVPDRIEPLPLL